MSINELQLIRLPDNVVVIHQRQDMRLFRDNSELVPSMKHTRSSASMIIYILR